MSVDSMVKSWASSLAKGKVIDEKEREETGIQNVQSLSVDAIFSFAHVTGKLGDFPTPPRAPTPPPVSSEKTAAGDSDETGKNLILIKSLIGRSFLVKYDPNDTGMQLKEKIEKKYNIPVKNQRLVLCGKEISDVARSRGGEGEGGGDDNCDLSFNLNRGHSLCSYNIQNSSTIHLVIRYRISGPPSFVISDKYFAPQFDYDYTKDELEGLSCTRGGLPFTRPNGWIKKGINVSVKYPGDQTWLGEGGMRRNSSQGEWPVAYFGTGLHRSLSMAGSGFLMSVNGPQYEFSEGVYVSPSPTIAERYAQVFDHEGVAYKAMLMCRVNPSNMVKVPIVEENEDFWVLKSAEEVRPYAICFKKN